METADDEQTLYFRTAQSLMDMAGIYDDLDRRIMERAAVRYFWSACGMREAGVGAPTSASEDQS